eukprot:gene8346-8432_t
MLLIFTNGFLLDEFARCWDIKPVPLKTTGSYSCAIVLGGFSGEDDHGDGFFNTASDRFIQGVKLLKTGKVSHILISGGNGSLFPGKFAESDWVRKQLLELQIPDSCIVVENRSRNTIENAAFSKQILAARQLQPPYILVTSAFHMRRSLGIFGREKMPFIPDADIIGRWNYYIKEIFGELVNRIKGIKVKEGLLAIADTRITSGTDTTVKKKITIEQKDNFSLFIMTSGLRSVRDKALVYFTELMETKEFNKLYKAVNAFGEQIKRVAQEDKASLEKAGFKFDLNTIIGGQLKDDEEHKLFLLYPEGNWVELGQGAPYVIIGNSGHGKAILNRILDEDSSLKLCLKTGFLSFDSTRVSSNNVDFPIDVALYRKDSFHIIEKRYEKKDLEYISTQWAEELKAALEHISEDWMDAAFDKLD